jgi:NAD-dependent deacetylase
MSRVPIPGPLAAALASARRVVALTGAGVSAESGVPTFRDALTGLWARYDPLELATPAAFMRQPKLVWDWYAGRRDAVRAALPNAGHHALVEIERRVPDFLLVTQNVDGLHARAGTRSLVELHGNIARVRCSRECGVVDRWDEPPDEGRGRERGEPARGDATPPRCALCGAFLRPDVVWFDELLPEGALLRAEDAARHCDLMIVAGTSAEVYPAAALPLQAKAAGAVVVEVNPHETPLSRVADYGLRERSGLALPALVAAAWPAPASSSGTTATDDAEGGGAK